MHSARSLSTSNCHPHPSVRPFCHISCNYMALKPPSRFNTQLFAYLLVARKTAASAISEASPNRFKGMAFRASERASGVIAVLYIRKVQQEKRVLQVFQSGTSSTIVRNGNIPAVMSVSIYPGTITLTRVPFSPNSAAKARVKPHNYQSCSKCLGNKARYRIYLPITPALLAA
jgi:hypothetical protein